MCGVRADNPLPLHDTKLALRSGAVQSELEPTNSQRARVGVLDGLDRHRPLAVHRSLVVAVCLVLIVVVHVGDVGRRANSRQPETPLARPLHSLHLDSSAPNQRASRVRARRTRLEVPTNR